MNSLCEMIHHRHRIHELRLHANTRKTVDVMTAQMWALIQSWNPEEDGNELRLLINMSESGVPPINYMIQQIREGFAEHRDRLADMHVREAYLAPTSSELLLSLASVFAKVLPIKVELQFFAENDYDSAIAWLRQTDADVSEAAPSTEDSAGE